MSTGLLYHGFGIRGYDYVCTRYESDKLIFTVRQKDEDLRCPVCNSPNVIRRGKTEIGKGHRYLSIVLDLDTGAVWYLWVMARVPRPWSVSGRDSKEPEPTLLIRTCFFRKGL